jgi:hypothetical protein
MNNFSNLFAAGLVCALIAAGTVAASANVGTSDRVDPIVSASARGVTVAINPQPLPPREDPEADHFDW